MVALDEYFHHNGTKTRSRCCTTSISPGFRNRPLLIDHCSLIIKRSADAYGSTLIFTGPGADGLWFTDDDAQSDYGANEIIFCGYRYDPESQLHYVRNRTYNPVLGRWIQCDPIGYEGGINLYGYVAGSSPIKQGPTGLAVAGLVPTTWETPGAKFIPGMGTFTASIFRKSSTSSGVIVSFFPREALKKKKCWDKITFVQYERDATALTWTSAIDLPAKWKVDTAFPYPFSTPSTPGRATADMRDNPSVEDLGHIFYWQWDFEARVVAICTSGKGKGESYGAVEWGFYFDWGIGRVTRWIGGHGISGGPVNSNNVGIWAIRPFNPSP